MPIVFVHGVATREDQTNYPAHWSQIETFLRRYIAPAISADPDRVDIVDAYWGDIGVRFAWDGASRPHSPLLGQGAAPAPSAEEQALALAAMSEAMRGLPAEPAAPRSAGILIAAGPAAPPASAGASKMRLKDFSPDQLSDLALAVIQTTLPDPGQQTLAAIAADAVAHDDGARNRMAACASRDEELSLFKSLIEERYKALQQQGPAPALIAQGGWDWPDRFKDRLGEAVGRIGSIPGFVVSRVLAELRKPLNDKVTLFLGDVFTYLDARGDAQAPGDIPLRVLARLQAVKAGQRDRQEPLVVLSHSMGGQIVYDLVTCFIPQIPAYHDLRIDFWCATASQVGLFEEMKRFLNSQDRYGKQHNNRVPFPDRRYLGGWWNVWDHNDFISYSAKSIISDVDDENYNSGMSVLHAHSGYFARPSFYRDFADKLQSAGKQNWWRP